jgi:hypothetical protein
MMLFKIQKNQIKVIENESSLPNENEHKNKKDLQLKHASKNAYKKINNDEMVEISTYASKNKINKLNEV